jgi:hypothetical protein
LSVRVALEIPATQVTPAGQVTRELRVVAVLVVMPHTLSLKGREFFAGCVQRREEMVLPEGVGLAAAAHP